LLAIAGAFMMKLMASFTLRGQAAYAKAGAFATEVISGIRTIAAFASEPKAQAHYSVHLEGARKLGVRVGTVGGLGMGITMFILFSTYGLALWYGSTLIIAGEMTGGDVLSW
jgi:ATP-binding cassette subfamily B (MDR/TAP) protein 1